MRGRTLEFLRDLEGEEMTEIEQTEVRRMAHRHNQINRLYKEFKKRLGIPDAPPEADPDKTEKSGEKKDTNQGNGKDGENRK